MSAYEKANNLSVLVKVVAGVAAALPYRFCQIDTADTANLLSVKTHVPGANGAVAQGILAMKADPKAAPTGTAYAASSMVVPGCQALVELGEAVTDLSVPLRVGGNSTEVDGAAYLANATGDVIVAYPLKLGVVGEIVPVLFIGYGGLIP